MALATHPVGNDRGERIEVEMPFVVDDAQWDELRHGSRETDPVKHAGVGAVLPLPATRAQPRARRPHDSGRGLAYVLIGALAGALLASAGPPLMEGYASASDAGREAARVTLETLGHAVQVGLWGTLELLPFSMWLLLIGWLVRHDWPRFATLSVVVGVGALASSARTGLTGRTLVELSGPLDFVILAALGLFFVWQLWLVVRLWREPSTRAD